MLPVYLEYRKTEPSKTNELGQKYGFKSRDGLNLVFKKFNLPRRNRGGGMTEEFKNWVPSTPYPMLKTEEVITVKPESEVIEKEDPLEKYLATAFEIKDQQIAELLNKINELTTVVADINVRLAKFESSSYFEKKAQEVIKKYTPPNGVEKAKRTEKQLSIIELLNRYITYRDLTKRLQELGCTKERHSDGSHEQWDTPKGQRFMVVNHGPNTIMSLEQFKKIKKVLDNEKIDLQSS